MTLENVIGNGSGCLTFGSDNCFICKSVIDTILLVRESYKTRPTKDVIIAGVVNAYLYKSSDSSTDLFKFSRMVSDSIDYLLKAGFLEMLDLKYSISTF